MEAKGTAEAAAEPAAKRPRPRAFTLPRATAGVAGRSYRMGTKAGPSQLRAPQRRGNGRPSCPAGQPGPGLTADGEGAGPGESP